MTNPDHYVTISSSAGHKIQVLLDAENAVITGGHGGWDVIQRPKRTSLTRFAGRDPYRMDLPVIFEGIRGNVSQEEHITALVKMAEPVGHLKQPPTLLVVGATPLPHVHWWVIENMKWDNQNVTWVRKGASLVRLRQSVVISLLEYVDEEVIITQPTPAIAAGAGPVGTKIKTGSGLTAKQEAQKEYGDPGLYTKILEANPWLPIDQRLGIANGVTFVVPPANSK